MVTISRPAADATIAMAEPARVQATNRVNVQKIVDAHLFGLAAASNDLTDPANAPKPNALGSGRRHGKPRTHSRLCVYWRVSRHGQIPSRRDRYQEA